MSSVCMFRRCAGIDAKVVPCVMYACVWRLLKAPGCVLCSRCIDASIAIAPQHAAWCLQQASHTCAHGTQHHLVRRRCIRHARV
jgi:hypothetical protein